MPKITEDEIEQTFAAGEKIMEIIDTLADPEMAFEAMAFALGWLLFTGTEGTVLDARAALKETTDMAFKYFEQAHTEQPSNIVKFRPRLQ